MTWTTWKDLRIWRISLSKILKNRSFLWNCWATAKRCIVSPKWLWICTCAENQKLISGWAAQDGGKLFDFLGRKFYISSTDVSLSIWSFSTVTAKLLVFQLSWSEAGEKCEKMHLKMATFKYFGDRQEVSKYLMKNKAGKVYSYIYTISDILCDKRHRNDIISFKNWNRIHILKPFTYSPKQKC